MTDDAGDEPGAQRENMIVVRQDGPYLVTGETPIRNSKGETLKEAGPYALCRCGGSSNKPFCDRTHAKNGFDGTETADRGPIAARRVAFRATGITIYDDRSVCQHAGNCTDNLASVFKLGVEPWIDPEGAGADAIAAVIDTCPSGALSYALGDASEPEEKERAPVVTASVDGPYVVEGGLLVQSPDGSAYEQRARQTLCRCGGSKNKPFCDGTHWHIGFTDGQ